MNDLEVSQTNMLTVSTATIRDAFAEWDRRYREEPERFMTEVEHLLRTTPEGYGELAARYFVQLAGEVE